MGIQICFQNPVFPVYRKRFFFSNKKSAFWSKGGKQPGAKALLLFQVKIQFTGFQALTSTIHYLYGCRWCDYFKDLSPKVLLELVILTDKYLLTDFNESISHEIVRSCSKVDQVVEIYEASLHKEYPVRGIQDNNLSLSAISCASSLALAIMSGISKASSLLARINSSAR